MSPNRRLTTVVYAVLPEFFPFISYRFALVALVSSANVSLSLRKSDFYKKCEIKCSEET